MLKAGDLNQKISIKRPVSTQNASGGYATGYATVLNTYARVRELRSNPQLEASQESITNELEVAIRYRKSHPINNGDIINWRSFTYEINNILVDPLRTSIIFRMVSSMNTSDRGINDTEYTPFPFEGELPNLNNIIIQIDNLAVNKAVNNTNPNVIQIGDKIWGFIGDAFIAGTVNALPYTTPGNITLAVNGMQ